MCHSLVFALAPRFKSLFFSNSSLRFSSPPAQIHNQPCHVVYTNYRPVPLQHYIFPAGGEGLHLVVDEKGTFREDNFQVRSCYE